MKKIRNLLITSIVFYVVLKLTGCSTGRPPDIYIIEQTTAATTTATPDITSDPQNTVETEEPENIILPVLPEYQEIYNKNNDMIGWIQIPNTAINYPIFQTDNNSDYLELNAEKQPSKSGAIFMDYKCNYHKSDNIIIYGHNLLSGEGFANLGHYYPWSASSNGSLDFYKKHPVIIYNDIYTKTRNQYKIFAGIFTPDTALIEFTATALRIYCGVMCIFGIQIACQMTFVSIGNAPCSIIVAIVRKFVLLLPLIYIMPGLIKDKAMGVYTAEPVADFIAVTFTAILFTIQFKKALNSLTIENK